MLRRFLAITLGLLIFMVATNVMAASEDEIEAAIEKGIRWLAAKQNSDGSWGAYEHVAMTGLALLKLEDRAHELGHEYPFENYPYGPHIKTGLKFIFRQAGAYPPPGPPGICFAMGGHETYNTAIAMMAVAASRMPGAVVNVGNPFVDGMTYKQVLDANVKFFANTQNPDGGWRYWAGDQPSDNSNSGWVVLGLAYAEAPAFGFGCVIPASVRTGLNQWIDFIQNDVNGDFNDGGSGYDHPDNWVNILKTGNLLHQMAFYGDTVDTQRVKYAIKYIERLWNKSTPDPGWRGTPASYQATFTMMKGLEVFRILELNVPGPIDWFDEVSTVLVTQQNSDGSWPWCMWGDGQRILSTTWALLTLERVVPPPPVIRVSIDIKPQSCPNPLNVGKKGVLPVAIAGTGDLDVMQVDPASVKLEGVSPLRWDWEDVATPYQISPENPDAYDCTEAGPDGVMDLTLKFKAQEVVAALGEVNDGEVLILTLTGNLKDEFGGTAIQGGDVVIIIKKGKKAPASLAYAAGAPFPVPGNPEVWIPYRLGDGVEVSIAIYNASGQLIRSLDLGYQNAGAYMSKGKAAHWDGKNEIGEEVSSGIYFYTIQAGDFMATRKIVMVR